MLVAALVASAARRRGAAGLALRHVRVAAWSAADRQPWRRPIAFGAIPPPSSLSPSWAAAPVLQPVDWARRGLHTAGWQQPTTSPPTGQDGDGDKEKKPSLDPLPPWLTTILPAAALPYAALARLDKPAGTALLLWPGLWSIAAAAPVGALPDARLTALFTVGALLLRGAGCTINDLWDRELDARVARTAGRPLACGAVSVPGAVAFLGAQLAAGAAVLWQFDAPTIALGVASLPLVFSYPLAKRVLAWPQAVLGATFNWGALLGWSAAVGAGVVCGGGGGELVSSASPPSELVAAGWAAAASSPVPLLLYAGGFAWTQWYDTVYAYQDIKDDEAAGVRSSARTLRRLAGEKEAAGLGWMAASAGALVTAAGAAAGLGAPFYAGMAGVAALSARQFARLDLGSPASCGAAFRAHAGLGGLAWAAIVAGRVCGGA